MTRAAKLAWVGLPLLGLALAVTVIGPARAEDDPNPPGDTSRGVRILEAPTPAPADRPTPPAAAPSAPAAAPASPPPPAPSATLAPPEPAPPPPPPAVTPPSPAVAA